MQCFPVNGNNTKVCFCLHTITLGSEKIFAVVRLPLSEGFSFASCYHAFALTDRVNITFDCLGRVVDERAA